MHRHRKAWGLFWAGGGLDACREVLAQRAGSAVTSAIVPATPEALLRLVLALEEPDADLHMQSKNKNKRKSIAAQTNFPWRAVAITSLAWLFVLTGISCYSSFQIQQQSELIKKLIDNKKSP